MLIFWSLFNSQITCHIKVATLSRIVRNLINFAKKAGKYIRKIVDFNIVRKMSGIFYDVVSGNIPYFVFLFNVKKELIVK